MAKRVKVLGPSNDNIPAEELALAKLIQTAEHKGLHSIRGSYQRGDGVCAIGCSRLDPENPARGFCSVIAGNDGYYSSHGPGYDLGAGFYEAMSK